MLVFWSTPLSPQPALCQVSSSPLGFPLLCCSNTSALCCVFPWSGSTQTWQAWKDSLQNFSPSICVFCIASLTVSLCCLCRSRTSVEESPEQESEEPRSKRPRPVSQVRPLRSSRRTKDVSLEEDSPPMDIKPFKEEEPDVGMAEESKPEPEEKKQPLAPVKREEDERTKVCTFVFVPPLLSSVFMAHHVMVAIVLLFTSTQKPELHNTFDACLLWVSYEHENCCCQVCPKCHQ